MRIMSELAMDFRGGSLFKEGRDFYNRRNRKRLFKQQCADKKEMRETYGTGTGFSNGECGLVCDSRYFINTFSSDLYIAKDR